MLPLSGFGCSNQSRRRGSTAIPDSGMNRMAHRELKIQPKRLTIFTVRFGGDRLIGFWDFCEKWACQQYLGNLS